MFERGWTHIQVHYLIKEGFCINVGLYRNVVVVYSFQCSTRARFIKFLFPPCSSITGTVNFAELVLVILVVFTQ